MSWLIVGALLSSYVILAAVAWILVKIYFLVYAP
jgi:hypothetical protein